jgi:hypothetical protein
VTYRKSGEGKAKNQEGRVGSGEVIDDATSRTSLFVPGATSPPNPIRVGQSDILDRVPGLRAVTPSLVNP